MSTLSPSNRAMVECLSLQVNWSRDLIHCYNEPVGEGKIVRFLGPLNTNPSLALQGPGLESFYKVFLQAKATRNVY